MVPTCSTSLSPRCNVYSTVPITECPEGGAGVPTVVLMAPYVVLRVQHFKGGISDSHEQSVRTPAGAGVTLYDFVGRAAHWPRRGSVRNGPKACRFLEKRSHNSRGVAASTPAKIKRTVRSARLWELCDHDPAESRRDRSAHFKGEGRSA